MRRLLLLAYPSRWRARYGPELLALFDDSGLGPCAVIDVIRAGFVERARASRAAVSGGCSMVFGPAWRHPGACAVVAGVVLAPTLSFVGLSLLGYGLGVGAARDIAGPLGAWLDARAPLNALMVLAPALAVVVAVAPLLRLGLRHRGSRTPELEVGVRLLWANVGVVVASLLVGATLAAYFVAELAAELGA